MSRPRFTAAVLSLATVAVVALVPGGVAGGEPATAESGANTARSYFTDVELINQNGEPMRFYSDLLAGKVVVINSFFTTCDGSCPVTTKNLQAVQEWLGDRLGRDVTMISITVDPVTDTPQRVQEFAAKWGARPGWYFLTGERANVELALKKLGQYVEEKEAHAPLLIVGNEPTGLWKKAFGLAQPKDLVPIVESVLEDRG